MTEGTGRVIRRDGVDAKGRELKWHRERSVMGSTICGSTYIRPSLIVVAPIGTNFDQRELCFTCFAIQRADVDGVELKSEYYFRLRPARKSQVPKWHITLDQPKKIKTKGTHNSICGVTINNRTEILDFRRTAPSYITICMRCVHKKGR